MILTFLLLILSIVTVIIATSVHINSDKNYVQKFTENTETNLNILSCRSNFLWLTEWQNDYSARFRAHLWDETTSITCRIKFWRRANMRWHKWQKNVLYSFFIVSLCCTIDGCFEHTEMKTIHSSWV
jgi:hypothetical protein